MVSSRSRAMANAATRAREVQCASSGRGTEQLDIFLAMRVGLGLAFQVGHFIEHAIQLAVWISGKSQWVVSNFCGRDTPFMSAPVTKAVSAIGAYLFPRGCASDDDGDGDPPPHRHQHLSRDHSRSVLLYSD